MDILPKRSTFGIIESTRTYQDPLVADTEITQTEQTAVSQNTALIANVKEDFIVKTGTNRLSFSVNESSRSERIELERLFEEGTLEERQRQDLVSDVVGIPRLRI